MNKKEIGFMNEKVYKIKVCTKEKGWHYIDAYKV